MADLAATYGGDPAGSPVDRVRLELGDTNVSSGGALFSNAEIEWFLYQHGDNALLAAAAAAEALTARFAGDFDRAVGQTRKSLSQRWEHYRKLADRLRRRAGTGTVLPYVGGVEHDERETDRADSTLVQPSFTESMHDNPEAGRSERIWTPED